MRRVASTALSTATEMEPHIITLTANPAVDMACIATEVRPTHKVRTTGEKFDPGGGGINVARVIRALGGDATAFIMTGGVTGQLIEELLSEVGVGWERLPIAGRTRISMNVQDQKSGLEYRFVSEGPLVASNEWTAALDRLGNVQAAWIVASGSLPPGIPATFYAQVAAIAARRGIKFALDTSGQALRESLGGNVTLLKLSLNELEQLVGRQLPDPMTQEAEALALIAARKAQMVSVSLGRDGAFLATDAGLIRMPAPDVSARSAVGAGDSFFAGLILGLARGLTSADALKLGIAAGTAAVMTFGTAQVQRSDVDALFQKIPAGPDVYHETTV
jgi:6-phosphofructokinase 2